MPWADVACVMRSAAAFGELADFVRARKGCESGQQVKGCPGSGKGTCLEGIESFGLLHDGEHEAQAVARGMRRSYTGQSKLVVCQAMCYVKSSFIDRRQSGTGLR